MSMRATAASFHRKGVESFDQKNYEAAAELFKQAMDHIPLTSERDSQVSSLGCDRCLSLCLMGQHAQAYLEANTAVKLDPTNLRALILAARSLVCLGKYAEACKLYESVLEKSAEELLISSTILGNPFPSGSKVSVATIPTSEKNQNGNLPQQPQPQQQQQQQQRISKDPAVAIKMAINAAPNLAAASFLSTTATSGVTNPPIQKAINPATPLVRQPLSLAYERLRTSSVSGEFLHPGVICETFKGMGRGLLTTSDIAKGELILQENAFAIVHTFDTADLADALLLAVRQEGKSALISMEAVVQDMFPAPNVRSAISPPPKLLPFLAARTQFRPESVIHSLYVAAYNGHTLGYNDSGTPTPQDGEQGYGLFPCMSLINHSCWPNVTHFTADGRAAVRATRDIKAGEQICDAFVNIYQTGIHRRKELKQAFSFRCRCERCFVEPTQDVVPVATPPTSLVSPVDSLAPTPTFFRDLELKIEHVRCPKYPTHYMLPGNKQLLCSQPGCGGTLQTKQLADELNELRDMHERALQSRSRAWAQTPQHPKYFENMKEAACLWDRLLERVDTAGIVGSEHAFLIGVLVARASVADPALETSLVRRAYSNSVASLPPTHPLLIPLALLLAQAMKRAGDPAWQELSVVAANMHQVCYGSEIGRRYAQELAFLRM